MILITSQSITMAGLRDGCFVLLACLLAWAYGPGMPSSDAELFDAFNGKSAVVCGESTTNESTTHDDRNSPQSATTFL